MKPLSNKIMIPLLISDIVMMGITTILRSSLGSRGYISTMVILLLTLVSGIVAIKARINWERSQEYQKKMGLKQ